MKLEPGKPPAPSARTRGRTALFAGVAALLLFILIPAGMEGVVRVVRPQAKSWLDIHALHPGGLPFHHNRPSFHEWIDIGVAQFGVATDSRGHRIAEKPAPVPAGAKSVWFVGDSFTFGQGSSFENGFVGRVAAAGFRVDNGGVNGWGPAQYLADFEYNLRAQKPPDAVVLSTYLGNDYFDMIWDKRPVVEDGILGNSGDLKSVIKRNSHLYRLVSNVYHAHFPGPRQYYEVIDQMATEDHWRAPDLRRAEVLYRNAIRAFANRCEQLSIPLLVLIIPTKEAVSAAREPAALDYGLVARRTDELLTSAGIEHVDLTPALAELGGDNSFLPFDGHFTPEANARAGRAVLGWLHRRF